MMGHDSPYASAYFCGQWREFLATDPQVRVPFSALPDFLKIVGPERGPLSLVVVAPV
jgi:hypothetical protein